jgi:hypothetical protein
MGARERTACVQYSIVERDLYTPARASLHTSRRTLGLLTRFAAGTSSHSAGLRTRNGSRGADGGAILAE